MSMVAVQEGQCGLCAHFGENNNDEPRLIQIRTKHEAPQDFVLECGHPRHAPLHLQVTPISGCDGFTPADETQAASA
jgi:hypothetical protein